MTAAVSLWPWALMAKLRVEPHHVPTRFKVHPSCPLPSSPSNIVGTATYPDCHVPGMWDLGSSFESTANSKSPCSTPRHYP